MPGHGDLLGRGHKGFMKCPGPQAHFFKGITHPREMPVKKGKRGWSGGWVVGMVG